MKNLKFKALLLFTLSLPILVNAQFFSGEVTYATKIVPKSDSVNLDKIMELKHGTTASYVITSKHYKSTYYKDDQYSYSYTYDDETKRMYDDHADQPYVTYRDSRKSNVEYSVPQIFKDSIETILGYECYLVTSDSDYEKSKTYYSDKLRVDYSDFEGHQVGNWYNRLKEVDGAITLKSVTELETHYEIQEAVKIEERKVKMKEFELPKKPIAASFTALDKRAELRPPSDEQIHCYKYKVGSVSKENGEKFTSYVSFLLQKNGEIKFIEPYEKDADGFYKIAVDIIENCGFQFSPGKIDGESVDSQFYFPVEFRK